MRSGPCWCKGKGEAARYVRGGCGPVENKKGRKNPTLCNIYSEMQSLLHKRLQIGDQISPVGVPTQASKGHLGAFDGTARI